MTNMFMMKRSIYIVIYTCVLLLCVSCKQPYCDFSNVKKMVMEEGDSLTLYVANSDEVKYYTLYQDSICKIVPLDKYGTKAMVYAVSPGIDTITYSVHYSAGIFAYGMDNKTCVEVIAKDTTQY